MSAGLGRLVLFLISGAVAALALSCGGGATPVSPRAPTITPPPTPPPPRPLEWRGVPERITVVAGQPLPEDPEVVELVSGSTPVAGASVAASLHGPDGATAQMTAGSGDGEYLLLVTAERAGEWRVELTASLAGYEDAAAETLLVSVPDFDLNFDLAFWRDFVFDAYDCPTGPECDDVEVEERAIWVLPEHPDFHIASTGFTSAEIDRITRRLPQAVEQLTGEPFRGSIERGPDESLRRGVVVIPGLAHDDEEWGEDGVPCGIAYVGALAGEILLNLDCARVSSLQFEELLTHELGHALGFFHVPPPHLMQSTDWIGSADFTPPEISHALLAHALGRGAPYTDNSLEGTKRRKLQQIAPAEPPRVSCYRSRGRLHH